MSNQTGAPGELHVALAACEPTTATLEDEFVAVGVRVALSYPDGMFVAIQVGDAAPVIRRVASMGNAERGEVAQAGEWVPAGHSHCRQWRTG